MPNIKSAKKRVLVSRANYERNKAYRSALRTAVKKIDQATVKGIIHKNNAARKKSALVTRYNKVKA